MKKLFTVLFLIGGLSFSQDIVNYNFENWDDPPTNPVGWVLDTQSGDCSFSRIDGETGFGLRCNVTNNGTGNDGEFYQIVSGIIEGNNYDLSIRVKGTSNITNALRFWGVWQDENGASLASSNIQPTTYFSTSTNWSTYQILGATAPTGAVKLKWAIRLYGLQITDFDEVLTPVPVELTTFTASALGNYVKLDWETATEVNNYGFEIQRKSSLENYKVIDFVHGNGNSNSPKLYSYEDKSANNSGKYTYRLKQIDIDGTYEYSDEVEVILGKPAKIELAQNYPNPFNPVTSIQFNLPNDSQVRLSVFNILGEEIAQLLNEKISAGYHTINFNGSNLNSGIYFYQLQTDNFTQIRKMILVK